VAKLIQQSGGWENKATAMKTEKQDKLKASFDTHHC
jgi:hypothetical protein